MMWRPLLVMWWWVLGSILVSSEKVCKFPANWSGHWFQSGVPHLLTINTSVIETKGICVENDGDKFIIEDRSDNCFRCVVIHEKHRNVLQYKETFCDRRDSLDNLCGQITGDAILYSMFRSDAGPTECPFTGGPPFTFTYNRGTGECSSPVSRVDPCTDESRLLLRYQACPDVHGTESTVEELVCLASWKDGSTRYLVGKLHHAMAHSDEDRYRCFVYERSQGQGRERRSTYDVAQSGDATCNGLLSAKEGSRTMRLTKIDKISTRCHFPPWVTEHHVWHTLDHQRSYHFSKHNATLRIAKEAAASTLNEATGGGHAPSEHGVGVGTSSRSGPVEMRMVCHSTEGSAEKQEMVVAHVTTGCQSGCVYGVLTCYSQSGYVCMVFYKRDGHVIELQQSNSWARVPEEACQSRSFNPVLLPFITLITAKPHLRPCPYLGRYIVTGLSRERHANARPSGGAPVVSDTETSITQCNDVQFQSLTVGCTEVNTMQFHSSCSVAETSTYSCHGSWEDNGINYLIASPTSRKSVGARRFCFIYMATDTTTAPGGEGGGGGGPLQVASVAESCKRNINPASSVEWAFNLTLNGQCDEKSRAAGTATTLLPFVVFLGNFIIMLNSR